MNFNTAYRLLTDRRDDLRPAIALKLAKSRCSHFLPDKLYLKHQYSSFLGKHLNLKNPETFNEKLQWLKLYNRNPQYRQMVDKFEARKYVSDIIGDEYIIPTLGVWERFEDIDFNLLPNQFVLKCTHDSGSVVICKNKADFDYKKAKNKINKGLENDLFWFGREWPYKGLKRRIIAEKYMEDTNAGELRDYKFFCFNGICKCFKVDFDRFIEHHANYYDPDKNLMKFGEVVCPPNFEKIIEVPNTIDQMMGLSEKLSEGIPFLRVDFYDVDGKIYFGELTFFPASGFGPFIPEEWDNKIGSWLKLPSRE